MTLLHALPPALRNGDIDVIADCVNPHELFAAAVGSSLAGAVHNVRSAEGAEEELLDVSVQAFVDTFAAAAEASTAGMNSRSTKTAGPDLEVEGFVVRARVTANVGETTSNARVQQLLERARDACPYCRGGRATVSVMSPSGMWLLDQGPMGESPARLGTESASSEIH